MPLTLSWKAAVRAPVDGQGLRPDLLRDADAAEVARRPILVGNAPAEIGDLFAVKGSALDGEIVLEGDLRCIRRLGAGLAAGRLTVHGEAGDGVGEGMAGGVFELFGRVGDGAFAAMTGGLVRVRGDAGDNLGGALPGATLGMREGVILVHGNIGVDAGLAMRRGLIAVAGASGPGLGRSLVAGSLFAFGPVGEGPGAGMKRGTLALFDVSDPPNLPITFRHACRFRPPLATLFLNRLRRWGFPVPPEAFLDPFDRYNGDRIAGGQGEIWVRVPEGRR